MNNYSKRSQFYRYEFITKDDFPLIRYALSLGNGFVIEIPSGAGRLLDIHSKHKREVFMVDLEPRMVEICQQEIIKKGLASRIHSVIGDMKNWQSPKRAELALVPRGGLQLLNSRKDIQQTLVNLSRNLKKNGVIYIDIADPWSSSDKDQSLLPEFMRFKKSRVIRGKSEFKLTGDNVLSRDYFSTYHKTYISVQLNFNVNQQITYQGRYRWSRIKLDDLISDLNSAGFILKELYSNYKFQEYRVGAARILCIAQKQE